ncbi:hypothetical protein BGZ99_007429 [Dissophora globulifera]|uniref:tRNA (adenine(58)-N(1))-methyltransferase catalytic subunit TRM61 n=1 Tax=Dissophora globulifera TaxID=979702 RepID=A0A9P6R9U7_9FUNG|nr:hypothetical protein BGZ99_007429 [Dissophora globulifera]
MPPLLTRCASSAAAAASSAPRFSAILGRSLRPLSTATFSTSDSPTQPQQEQLQEQHPAPVLPNVDPRFRYGDVLILNDNKGDRRLVGPLRPGMARDNNLGRLQHDQFIGLSPLSTVKTHRGHKYTLHWPTLDEYCTTVKRQASIMYPKDATTAVHLLDLFPGAHVLEAGTGNGSMTLYIQRAIQGPGSHLDTVDIRNEHSLQAEQNVERFWRGMYRPGILFWRSVGGLQAVLRHFKGASTTTAASTTTTAGVVDEGAEPGYDSHGRPLSALEMRRQRLVASKEVLPPNPHPPGHQYDAISLDLPDCKSVLLDLLPLLKPDRPMCLYIVNMSQILELAQWIRRHNIGSQLAIERVLEVDWEEWSVKSAAVRSKVRGRVHVGGLGKVSLLQQPGTSATATSDNSGKDSEHQEGAKDTFTTAADNIPDDAVGWICRPLHMPVGHTGFLVQLRKTSQDP